MLTRAYMYFKNKIWGPPKKTMLSDVFGEFMGVSQNGPFTQRMMEQIGEKLDPKTAPPADHKKLTEYMGFVPKGAEIQSGEGMALINSIRNNK